MKQNFRFWSQGISRKSFINWTTFFTVKVNGRGMYIPSCLESILAHLYAGAFFKVITDLMGEPSLCIFIRPLIVGGVGKRLMYFHLSSLYIISWYSFILFLSSYGNFLVGSLLTLLKLLFDMTFITVLWYSSWYTITIELHLSDLDIIALLLIFL